MFTSTTVTVYPICEIVLLAAFLGNAEASHSCSRILGKSYNTTDCDNDCGSNSALDECVCDAEETMLCPKLSSVPFKFTYVGYSKELTLSGDDLKKDFDSVAQHIALFLNEINVYTLNLMHFCREGVDYDIISDREFTSTPEHFLSRINISRFNGGSSVSKLDLSSNCAGDVVGNFKNSFHNLAELDMSGNLIKNIPGRTFEGLTHLESLKLDMNRIENITRESFVGLTSLTTLSLFSNYLEVVTEDLFGELRNLETLQLRNNKILTVSSNAFRNNVLLTNLILARNSIVEIPHSVFSSLTKLTDLSMHECHLKSLPNGLLKGLTRLKDIMLYNNNISHIPPDLFATNRMLQEVDLSGNKFAELPKLILGAFGLQGPASFHLANNNMKTLEIPLATQIKVATQLDLSRNCFTNVTELKISKQIMDTSRITEFVCEDCCLTSVPKMLLKNVASSVNFAQNRIEYLNMNLLANVAHLDSIDLSHNLIKTIKMEWVYPLVQNSSKSPNDNPETKIILRYNPIVCDCHILPFLKFIANQAQPPKGMSKSLITFDVTSVFCNEPDSLRDTRITQILRNRHLALKLVCNVTSGCPERCKCYFLAIEDVVVVNCTEKGMKDFPTLPNTGKHLIVHLENNELHNLPGKGVPVWHIIRELYVENNVLSSLDNLTITRVLKVLYMHNNKFSNFHPFMESFFDSYNNVSLSLSANPWECSCDLQRMKVWIYNNRNVVDFKQMSCIWPGTDTTVLLANATDVQLCPELFQQQVLLRVLLPTFASIVVAFSITATLMYRYKSEIQLWMFTRGICLRLVTEEDVDSDKRYDAFVSYSTKDEEWVATELVPGLENGTPAYTLCIHNRDWPVGEWIPDQILRSVQQSRRTIIILTDNFIESDWSRLEFRAAYRQALTDQVNRVLVLIPGDSLPNLKKLDSDLRGFITLNTYIKWTDPHFWRKLRCAMPRTKMSVRRSCGAKHHERSKNITPAFQNSSSDNSLFQDNSSGNMLSLNNSSGNVLPQNSSSGNMLSQNSNSESVIALNSSSRNVLSV